MIEKYFRNQRFAERHRAGPLRPYIDAFIATLEAQGYAKRSLPYYVCLIGKFNRWLQCAGVELVGMDEISTGDFLHSRNRNDCVRRGEVAVLKALLEYLREAGVVARPIVHIASDPVDRVTGDFADYLRQERGVSVSTVVNYCPVARLFLSENWSDGFVNGKLLSARDVQQFVLRHAHEHGPKRAQLLLTALRSLLRFMHLRGQTDIALAEHVPKVAVWRLATLPKFLGADEVEKTLRHCDRRRIMGRRDYALLLLLARLGLRAGEVLTLELGDIHWDAAEIVVRGKGPQRKCFPLSQEIGQALAAYLRTARPPCDSRRVFVRTRAPFRGLGHPSSVSTIVARALARAGLAPPSKGAHLFRHSLATEMLRNGASLGEIGQILHHKSPDTTAIYAKVNLVALQNLAQPWPGNKP